MPERFIGKITHYYGKIGVAVLHLEEVLSQGDRIRIHGHTTDFEQTVDSMELEHQRIDSAGPGQDIAIRVASKVRLGDKVYLAPEEAGEIDSQTE